MRFIKGIYSSDACINMYSAKAKGIQTQSYGFQWIAGNK